MLKDIKNLIRWPAFFFDSISYKKWLQPALIFISAYTAYILFAVYPYWNNLGNNFPYIIFLKFYFIYLLILFPIIPMIIWGLALRKNLSEFLIIYLYSQIALFLPAQVGIFTFLLNIWIMKAGMSNLQSATKKLLFWFFYWLFYITGIIGVISVSHYLFGEFNGNKVAEQLSHKNYEQALIYANQAVDAHETFAYRKRAYIHYKMGNKKEALADMEKYLENNKYVGLLVHLKLTVKNSDKSKDKIEKFPNGIHKIYADKNQKFVEYEINVKDGKLDGDSVLYYVPEESFKEMITYKNGKKEGSYKHYFKGSMLDFELEYKDDKIVDIKYIFDFNDK